MSCSHFFLLCAYVTLYVVAVINSSNAALDCTTVDFPDGPAVDETDDGDVEANRTVHLQNVWTGRLSLSSQNFTFVEIHWDKPASDDSLCAYSVHYHPKGVTDKSKHLTLRVRPSTTSMVVTGLDIGTTYHIYVEAIFNKPVPGSPDSIQLLKSWLLIVTTLGYGPANQCNCHPAGTVGRRTDNCDRMTGQCECKDEPLTNGLKCDSCVDHTYMDNEIGCTACDQCDHIGSTKHCLPAPGGMKCVCNANFTGVHCRDCNRGFYRVGETAICMPCNCSGNENKTAENVCYSNGTCSACSNYTTGEHCEICIDGYEKDSMGSCFYPIYTEETTGHKVGIAILVILIIVATFALIVVVVRKLNRQRRQRQGSLKSSGSGVNFSTLDEEPDLDFNRGSRKLHIGGTSSNA